APPRPLRMFGRFQLTRLLGKSMAVMVWLAHDPRAGFEVMLTLPRTAPVSPAALERWLAEVRLAARPDHPNLARPLEIGLQDDWPYISVERGGNVTLGEWIGAHPAPAPHDAVGWLLQALRGLAFAHEAGVAHLDLQLHSLVMNESGTLRVMALGAGFEVGANGAGIRIPANQLAGAFESPRLHEQRQTAQRDLLACGVLLHRLLGATDVLDEPDTARVIARMPPLGREPVRLPWTTPHPVPEALRAIANRATSDQERQRYLNVRTLMRALEGWCEAQSLDGAGPLALVLDRLRVAGHLPALPDLGARVAGLVASRGRRTDEMAEHVLRDIALSFELLRSANSAQVRSLQLGGGANVMTVRRAIALLGVDGVRTAANTLRIWPGPVGPEGATLLKQMLERVALASRLAQALRPRGYDAELVGIVTLLQNLGRLLLQYHYADESEQIRRLMQPGAQSDGAELPGMTEEAASSAVIGVDTESIGVAVARHWGLGDELLHMVRRLPLATPVRKPDSDADLLRSVASAANETVDATALASGPRAAAALAQIGQRYARVLQIKPSDLRDALEAARAALRAGALPSAAFDWSRPMDLADAH
ncbi:MAG: HDOD domain-containing protein, partial [Burkholderiaceae bacterium]